MEDTEKGVKDPEVPPTSGTGVVAELPPDDEVLFEDDEVKTGTEGQRMVPLETAKAERKKRQELERELERLRTGPKPPDQDSPQPAFDWSKLGRSSEPSKQQPPDKAQLDTFNEQLREQLEENPYQTLYNMFTFMQRQQEGLQTQARRFAPDYDKLPVHEVSDAEMYAVATNPHALRALIAKVKSGGGRNPQPQAATPGPSNMSDTERQALIEQGKREALSTIRVMAKGSGLSGEAPGGGVPSTPSESYTLDERSMAYYRNRGYTDEQIKKNIIPKLVELGKRKQGVMV